MRKLHARLVRLERLVRRAPTEEELRTMSRAELLRLAGLPPDAGPEDIAAVVKAIEEDLAQTP